MVYHYIYRIDFLEKEHIGKYYIGKRTVNYKPENDKAYLGSGLFCKRYFSKYGTNGTYKKTILETNNSVEENSKREKEIIGDLYKTDPLCMNLCEGGLGKIKRNKIDVNGSKNPFYGKKHNTDSINKMKETKWKNHKPIASYSNGELLKIYNSTDEIKQDGFNIKCVYEVLAGRNKTHKNLEFKFINY